MFDVHGELAHLHVMQRRRAAEQHRLAMIATVRPARPSRLLHLYARLWWASRPRAARWAPTLLELRY